MNTKIDEHGNTVTSRFIGDGDRYAYDFEHCRAADGWIQYDTENDAWYFGVWVHPKRREIVTYAEGDEIRVTCPDDDAFRAKLAGMAEFYGPPPPAFIAIDPVEGVVTEFYTPRPTGEKEGG